MQVIAITNNKGGVGKTITTVSLGAALHQLHNARVLVVDFDQQGNTSRTLIGRNAQLEAHIGNAIIDMSFDEVILQTNSGLHLAPANRSLAPYDAMIKEQRLWQHRFKKTLAKVADQYDYVVIDCPPNLGTFTIMALVAADAYLIPTEPELFALDGLDGLTEVADGVVEALNPKLQFLGVTVTRYNKNLRNSMNQTVIQALGLQYGADAVLPSIRRDAAVGKAIGQVQTIYEYAPTSNVSSDYADLTTEILARLG